jgi:hypothetical protein
MKDAASIAKEWNLSWELNLGPSIPDLAKRIERYAARAVKAERERCVGIVFSAFDGLHGDFKTMERQIIDAIQAKRPSRRK